MDFAIDSICFYVQNIVNVELLHLVPYFQKQYFWERRGGLLNGSLYGACQADERNGLFYKVNNRVYIEAA